MLESFLFSSHSLAHLHLQAAAAEEEEINSFAIIRCLLQDKIIKK
jgi:hypothetical protein